MTDWMNESQMIGRGQKYELHSHSRHGFWMKRLEDGAIAQWTGDDSCEEFRDVFEKHGGDEFADALDSNEVAENAAPVDETGAELDDQFCLPSVPAGPYTCAPHQPSGGRHYVVQGADGVILATTPGSLECDRLIAERIAAALNTYLADRGPPPGPGVYDVTYSEVVETTFRVHSEDEDSAPEDAVETGVIVGTVVSHREFLRTVPVYSDAEYEAAASAAGWTHSDNLGAWIDLRHSGSGSYPSARAVCEAKGLLKHS